MTTMQDEKRASEANEFVQVREWRDLEPDGFVYLTGEACALGTTALFDLTKQGVAHLRDFLGLPPNAAFEAPHNRGRDADPHVASVMLPRHLVPQLAIHVLARRGYARAVWVLDENTVYATTNEACEAWRFTMEAIRAAPVRVFTYALRPDTRNRSAIWGRKMGEGA